MYLDLTFFLLLFLRLAHCSRWNATQIEGLISYDEPVILRLQCKDIEVSASNGEENVGCGGGLGLCILRVCVCVCVNELLVAQFGLLFNELFHLPPTLITSLPPLPPFFFDSDNVLALTTVPSAERKLCRPHHHII